MGHPKEYCKFCTLCGARFPDFERDPEGRETPVACGGCGRETYFSPAPVSVLMIRCENGILGCRRNIKPGFGKLALLGGYQEIGETAAEAAAREAKEESGVIIDPRGVEIFHEELGDGRYQIQFFTCREHLQEMPPFDPIACPETQELVILDGSQTLCFPTHQEAYQRYLQYLRDQALVEEEFSRLRLELNRYMTKW